MGVCSNFTKSKALGLLENVRTTNVFHSVTRDHSSEALTPGTPYFLRLSAVNDVGVGAAAPVESSQDYQDQRGVFAERDSPTSLRVTWGDVEDAHGAALTGWSVEWNKTNAEFQRGSAPLGDSTDHDFPYSGSWSRLVGPDAREFRITNLT